MRDRRRFSRKHFEMRGFNLYREGNWIPLPQRLVRSIILERQAAGTWAPEYPTVDATEIGDDLALELIAECRVRRIATA